MAATPSSSVKQQTRTEIINDFKTTLNGLMDISDTYAEQALNLQAVFVQIKRQAKGMIANLDNQLAQENEGDSTTDNEGNGKTTLDK